MKAFIFKNTNNNTAWLSAKALLNYAKNGDDFIAVFDKEYDFLFELPDLHQRIYFLDAVNIFKTLQSYDIEILDFDLDMFANDCKTYQEYISKKISANFNNISIQTFKNTPLDNIIKECDKHQFTDVFLSLRDETYLKFCKDYLDDLVNVVTYNEDSISDLYYIINKCSFIITDNNIEYLISKELDKPKFVIVNNLETEVEKSDNTFVFDPFKNETNFLPPTAFSKDRKITEKINLQIINHSSVKDLLLLELKDALDKYKVPYVTYLPS